MMRVLLEIGRDMVFDGAFHGHDVLAGAHTRGAITKPDRYACPPPAPDIATTCSTPHWRSCAQPPAGSSSAARELGTIAIVVLNQNTAKASSRSSLYCGKDRWF